MYTSINQPHNTYFTATALSQHHQGTALFCPFTCPSLPPESLVTPFGCSLLYICVVLYISDLLLTPFMLWGRPVAERRQHWYFNQMWSSTGITCFDGAPPFSTFQLICIFEVEHPAGTNTCWIFMDKISPLSFLSTTFMFSKLWHFWQTLASLKYLNACAGYRFPHGRVFLCAC